jgi:hypothetical protein
LWANGGNLKGRTHESVFFKFYETSLEINLSAYKNYAMLLMVKDVVSRIISKFLQSQMLQAFCCKFFKPIHQSARFLSNRPNWIGFPRPLMHLPASDPTPLWFKWGGEHSLGGEGRGGANSDEGTDTLGMV